MPYLAELIILILSLMKFLTFLFLSLPVLSFAQKAKTASDCDKRLRVNSGQSIQISLDGKGSKDDFPKENKFSFKEDNSGWIEIVAENQGVLEIQVVSENGHDVDCALYVSPDCNDLRFPFASNLSRGNITGFRMPSEDQHVGQGPGKIYSRPPLVNKGDVVLLFVNDVNGRSSVKIETQIHTDVSTDIIALPEPVQDSNPEPVFKKTRVIIHAINKVHGSPLKASFDITGLLEGAAHYDTTSLQIELNPLQKIIVNANAEGFLFSSRDFTAGSGGGVAEIKIELEPLDAGDKVVLGDIKFGGDNAEFLPSSKNALLNLVKFMRENPTAVIEIQGHVNGQTRNSMKLKSLSKKRAKAVKSYMQSFGIEKSRMKYKGFGNKFMIYPEPENDRQAEVNRRVEIKILKK